MVYFFVLLTSALMVRATPRLREHHFAAFLIACGLATFAALRGPDVARDFLEYREWYQFGAQADGLIERPPVLESLFFASMSAGQEIGLPFRVFVWIVAVSAVTLKLYCIRRVSSRSAALWAGASCYLFSDFLLHEFTQLRTGLAIGAFMLSLVWLSEGRRRDYLAATLVGALIHSAALLGLLALPLSFFRRGRLDVLLLATLATALVARWTGVFTLERMGEMLSTVDARMALYVHFASSGVTEAAEPLSVRTVLVLLIILSSYIGLRRSTRRTPADPDEARLMTNRSVAFLMMLRLLVIAQIAFVVFADVREIALRVLEFYMACLPLYAAQLAQTKGMKLPSALVWLWLAATFGNYVFRAPVLVEAYSLSF